VKFWVEQFSTYPVDLTPSIGRCPSLLEDPSALAGAGALVEVEPMQEVGAMQEADPMQEVELMLEEAEELVARLVVQSAARLVAKLVAAVMTGIQKWASSAAAAIMHQLRTSMLGKAQASMASKKPASPGLSIAVASSSYPSPSSCHYC